MVDVRYIILLVILIATAWLIKKFPAWGTAVSIAVAAGALAYAVMFGVPGLSALSMGCLGP